MIAVPDLPLADRPIFRLVADCRLMPKHGDEHALYGGHSRVSASGAGDCGHRVSKSGDRASRNWYNLSSPVGTRTGLAGRLLNGIVGDRAGSGTCPAYSAGRWFLPSQGSQGKDRL